MRYQIHLLSKQFSYFISRFSLIKSIKGLVRSIALILIVRLIVLLNFHMLG